MTRGVPAMIESDRSLASVEPAMDKVAIPKLAFARLQILASDNATLVAYNIDRIALRGVDDLAESGLLFSQPRLTPACPLPEDSVNPFVKLPDATTGDASNAPAGPPAGNLLQ